MSTSPDPALVSSLRSALSAGELALEAGALERAASSSLLAVSLARRLESPPGLIQALLLAARTEMARSHAKEADAYLADGIAVTAALGLAEHQAQFLLLRSRLSWGDDPESTVAQLRDACSLLEGLNDATGLLVVRAELAGRLLDRGDVREAADEASRCRVLAAATGASEDEALAGLIEARAQQRLGDPAGALSCCARVRPLATRLGGDWLDQCRVIEAAAALDQSDAARAQQACAALISSYEARNEATADVLDELRDLLERAGFEAELGRLTQHRERVAVLVAQQGQQATALLDAGRVALSHGEISAAEQQFGHALELTEGPDIGVQAAWAHRGLAACAEAKGEIDIAAERFDRAGRAALAARDLELSAACRFDVGRLALEHGHVAEAVDILREVEQVQRAIGSGRQVYTLQLIASAMSRLGLREEAGALLVEVVQAAAGHDVELLHTALYELANLRRGSGSLDEAVDRFAALMDLALMAEQGDVAAACSLGLGECEVERGRGDVAEGHFRRALALAGEAQSTQLEAHAHFQLGKLLDARGDAQGEDHLVRALTLSASLAPEIRGVYEQALSARRAKH